MKQPVWIRERMPPAPPPTSFQPMRKKRQERVHKEGALILTAPSPRTAVRGERDPAMIEVILMRYRLLLLIFSVPILKP